MNQIIEEKIAEIAALACNFYKCDKDAFEEHVKTFIQKCPKRPIGEIDYELFNMAQLRTLCKEQGISAKSTKAETIKKLESHSTPSSAEASKTNSRENLAEVEPKGKKTEPVDENDLTKWTVVLLKNECEKLGLKKAGKKSDLIERIKAHKAANNETELKFICNQFGNWENKESSLIIDKATNTIIGRQADNGSIAMLDEDDIDYCRSKKLNYSILAIKANYKVAPSTHYSSAEEEDEDDE